MFGMELGDKENDYGKNYMKIKFNSEDYLPLNKPLKSHALSIIIRSVFQEGGKLYPQCFQTTLCIIYKNAAL